MFNTYCWMYGHLNLPHEYMVPMIMTRIMVVVVVTKLMMMMMMIIMLQGHCTRKQPDKSILYNTYYQWVSIFLMAQVLVLIIQCHHSYLI